MGEVVNLRTARKRKARADSEKKAAENRVLYGRVKIDIALAKADRARSSALHEGHRRDRPSSVDDA